MFLVDLNDQTNIIQVKTNNKNNSIIVAQGNFTFEKSDRTVLILFKYIEIAPDDHQELDQFLSIVISYVGKLYKSLICLRLPAIFDNRMDFDKHEVRNKSSQFMSITLNHLKYYPNKNLSDKQEQYELLTDKQLILNYSEELFKMIKSEAFWTDNWSLKGMCNRINSSTNNVMILDKINNLPCGFGQLFLLTTNDEIFGYLSNIVVNSSHQSKGLGRIIVNYLIGISVNQDMKQRGMNGTLCLQCADKGSGAVSAPKLYKRSGFEYLNDLSNRIAIFVNNEYYVKTDE